MVVTPVREIAFKSERSFNELLIRPYGRVLVIGSRVSFNSEYFKGDSPITPVHKNLFFRKSLFARYLINSK